MQLRSALTIQKHKTNGSDGVRKEKHNMILGLESKYAQGASSVSLHWKSNACVRLKYYWKHQL